jgi:hypothetical protein
MVAANRAWIAPITANLSNPITTFIVIYKNTGREPALNLTGQEEPEVSSLCHRATKSGETCLQNILWIIAFAIELSQTQILLFIQMQPLNIRSR